MPPKKQAAPKGAKGKAKAQDKEEKKQTKVAKVAAKGKSQASYTMLLSVCFLYSEIAYFESL